MYKPISLIYQSWLEKLDNFIPPQVFLFLWVSKKSHQQNWTNSAFFTKWTWRSSPVDSSAVSSCISSCLLHLIFGTISLSAYRICPRNYCDVLRTNPSATVPPLSNPVLINSCWCDQPKTRKMCGILKCHLRPSGCSADTHAHSPPSLASLLPRSHHQLSLVWSYSTTRHFWKAPSFLLLWCLSQSHPRPLLLTFLLSFLTFLPCPCPPINFFL